MVHVTVVEIQFFIVNLFLFELFFFLYIFRTWTYFVVTPDPSNCPLWVRIVYKNLLLFTFNIIIYLYIIFYSVTIWDFRKSSDENYLVFWTAVVAGFWKLWRYIYICSYIYFNLNFWFFIFFRILRWFRYVFKCTKVTQKVSNRLIRYLTSKTPRNFWRSYKLYIRVQIFEK